MDQWDEYIGKSRESSECVNRKDLSGLASLLDYPLSDSVPVDILPPFAHWLNGNRHARQSELGEDGHPEKGSFLPDIQYPRRMWAGSRVRLLKNCEAGQTLLHREEIKSVQHKSGHSGDMVFVTLQHDYYCEEELVLQEEQDIVYRAANAAALPVPEAKAEAEVLALHDYDWCRTIHPDPVLLFRYSAITFNGHRIHYDRDYARDIEHYPGLVVHGPLTATLLIDLYQRNNAGSRVSQFGFRGIRPLYDVCPFYIMGKKTTRGADLWAVDPEGRVAMQMKLSAQ